MMIRSEDWPISRINTDAGSGAPTELEQPNPPNPPRSDRVFQGQVVRGK